MTVQRSYDFVLQAATQGDPAPLDGLVVALSGRGAELTAQGQGVLKVAGGEATVQPVLENGVTLGLDVRVPFHEKTELLEAVLKVLVDVAEVSQARLLDPQRGETASLGNFSSITDEYLRMARYAGEYGGVSEAIGLSTMATAPDEDTGASVKWLLLLAAFLVALYAGWRTVVTFREAREQAEADRQEQELLKQEREAAPKR